MTNRDLVLTYLRSVSPRAASNRDIQEATGIESRREVYELTQELMEEGEIHGTRAEGRWLFWIGDAETLPEPIPAPRRARRMRPSDFRALARRRMSEHFNTSLERGWVGEVHKQFDFVAPYGRLVGHALYPRRVGGRRWAPAKGAAIAEHVWLLEKTGAPETFLVFGNDRRVPVMWLERFGNLVFRVRFFFLTADGELEELSNPAAVGRGRSQTEEETDLGGSPDSAGSTFHPPLDPLPSREGSVSGEGSSQAEEGDAPGEESS
jgi:hypothetical protein